VSGVYEVGAGRYDDESCKKADIGAELVFYQPIEQCAYAYGRYCGK